MISCLSSLSRRADVARVPRLNELSVRGYITLPAVSNGSSAPKLERLDIPLCNLEPEFRHRSLAMACLRLTHLCIPEFESFQRTGPLDDLKVVLGICPSK